ncbi:MAG: YCF48-related protein [Actinomycetota bacterium]|nr:YCF48-related protein [Actinomycetota bacterium]
MTGKAKVILISLITAVMALAMSGLVGANGGDDPPCPDFFYQDPLPISDWPVMAATGPDTAWAVALDGLIVKTNDGGVNWEYQWSELQRQPDTPPLRGISVVDANVVWICGDGGAVLVTSDGGESWTLKNISVGSQDFRLLGISALNDKVAWVVGQGGSVYSTADGGDSWNPCPVPGAQDLMGVSALSDTSAWVSGSLNVIAMTTDGGSNWNRVDPAVCRTSDIERVKAFDNNKVYAIGNSGCFFSTADGGGSWNFTDLGSSTYLFGMSFTDGQNGWLSGTDDYGAGYMAITGDGGGNWTRVDTPQLDGERNVTSIAAPGASTVWACSVDGALLRSTDGGGGWTRSDTVWTRASLDGVCAVDARSAWVVGEGGTILRTFNGGRTWVTQPTPISIGLEKVNAVDSSTAWAVGEQGAIVKTKDYGKNWVAQESGTDADLNRVASVSAGEAWASGYNQAGGIVLHTTDGGESWTPAQELAGAPVSAVAVLGNERVWFGAIESETGFVYRSTDGGASWSKSTLPPPVSGQKVVGIADIHPVDEGECLLLAEMLFAFDTFMYMYRSTDGGENWNVVGDYIVAEDDLFRLATVDGRDIWTCGAELDPYTEPTTVFHTVNGGADWERGKDFHRCVLFDIDTVDGKATWTVGYISTILRSTCPSLFSISPDAAPDTGAVKITDIAGSMFWEGMEVRLEKDVTTINATGVEVVSTYEATCSFDLTGAELGTYDVVARNPNGVESTLPDGFTVTSPTTWYLPEGSTGGDEAGTFETWVLVENPNQGAATVDITYMTPGGEVPGPRLTMGGESRLTVNVAEDVPDEWNVSTRVEADTPVVAERAMYWNASDNYRQCAHGSIGLGHLSRDWYLAEGSTGDGEDGSFETWVLVQNPGGDQAEVDITYMTPDGAVEGPHLSLLPGSRQTVNVADSVPDQWSVSTMIDSSVPVAAERSTYWNGNSYRQAANASIGASSPSREWYFAEGSTGSNNAGTLETWVLLANPSEHTVKAKVNYHVPDGQVKGPEVTIEPFSRQTVNVAETVPDDFHVSTEVVADGPVVAERAMYWNTSTYHQAAHGSIGSMSPRTEWMLAEGSTGSDALGGFDTWILIQNPSEKIASLQLTYMTPQGPVDGPDFKLSPDSRLSVPVAETVPGNWSVSTRVISDQPVVAERAVYWSAVTQPWRSAQSSRGCP